MHEKRRELLSQVDMTYFLSLDESANIERLRRFDLLRYTLCGTSKKEGTNSP